MSATATRRFSMIQSQGRGGVKIVAQRGKPRSRQSRRGVPPPIASSKSEKGVTDQQQATTAEGTSPPLSAAAKKALYQLSQRQGL